MLWRFHSMQFRFSDRGWVSVHFSLAGKFHERTEHSIGGTDEETQIAR